MSAQLIKPAAIAANEEALRIALRAYVPIDGNKAKWRKPKMRLSGTSEYALIFDTETTTDPSQRLRFGAFQLRKGRELIEAGFFYDAEALSGEELALLRSRADRCGQSCRPVAEFIDDIFYGLAYELRASIVGFNLPFDLSRLAIRHNSARGKMRGGFSFQLSQDRYMPHVCIRHLSARAAFIQFAGKRPSDTKGMRKRQISVQERRGTFIDLKTVAAALTSQSHSLASLAEYLQLDELKAETNEHGKALTAEYLNYALRDVDVTWNAYLRLREKYEAHGLAQTSLGSIKSEAGLGKAYLKEMNVQPWRVVQPDFPPALIGSILSTYFGGRTEVHIRREIFWVLYCDFLSMYPTVCTLMGLWRFVIAEGMTHQDATEEMKVLLARIDVGDLQKPEAWCDLATIVQVRPDRDIFPVRARYGQSASHTIGLNYLSADGGLWFTLADCIASKLLTGRMPKILQAIRFATGKPQSGLKPFVIAGDAKSRVNPLHDDFYRLLIDRRSSVKESMKSAEGIERSQLDVMQLALKILANSTSYGIFIEVNVDDRDAKARCDCHFGGEQPYPVETRKIEEPGSYFHPLLGTLITGAARLMLALSERLIGDAGLDWAFCDTDSMAIAKPESMAEAEFIDRAKAICDWFTPLNPYEKKGPIFKIEEENFGLATKGEFEPLYCFAISSKRYVLFNRDENGKPVIRKASAHGLGHLTEPYSAIEAPNDIPAPKVAPQKLGIARWHHDLWQKIIEAADRGKPDEVPLDYHSAFANPAVSRYAATTPDLLSWFKSYNLGRPYAEQLKPFNFLSAPQARKNAFSSEFARSGAQSKALKPIAPFFPKARDAAAHCFDRETGDKILPEALQTYREALVRYHLSPEAKFENGEAYSFGKTRRRHIHVLGIERIGKESNNWEEQAALGINSSDTVAYEVKFDIVDALERRIAEMGMSSREAAELAGLNARTVQKTFSGRHQHVSEATISKICDGLQRKSAEIQEFEQLRIQAQSEIAEIGIAEFARRIGMDAANLSKAISGKRKMPVALIGKLQRYFTP